MATEKQAEHHIENPFEYVLEKLAWSVGDVGRALLPNPARHIGQAVPQVRKIAVADLMDALRKGLADVGALRDDILFIGVIYPLAGLALARLAFSYDLLPMLFPLASGFAILGPVGAVGLYEMSRRREAGEPVTWASAFGVFRSAAFSSILGVGAILLLLFVLWLATAGEIYIATLGPEPPQTLMSFERGVFNSPQGWALIAAGIGAGFVFAMAAFVIGAVSFPLMLDRDVGMWRAIGTSIRAVTQNLGVMALWGVIVAASLALGSLPGLVGLIIVVPMLGHATWHLYRKLIA
jgi:uncharacterized membrane protein